jgi:hypothetical protein
MNGIDREWNDKDRKWKAEFSEIKCQMELRKEMRKNE